MPDNPKKRYRGSGRIGFFAHRDTFQRLIDAGYPLRTIYDDYAERLGVGYSQFAKYVRRYLQKPSYARHQTEPGSAAPATAASARLTPPPSTRQPAPAPPPEPDDKPATRPTSEPQKPFVWDPMAAHTREDLI
jgi:hypothetical protein